LRRLALIAAVLTAQGASAKTYTGSEAAALRCAHTISATAVTMHRFGLIETRLKDALMFGSVSILTQYVSGTQQEKVAAMRIMSERRTLVESTEDFREIAARCARQFPIE
jgi:hypothetical protein